MSKNFKFNSIMGFCCILIGLFGSLFYNYVLNLTFESIIPICLGFSTGNFIITMALIEEFFEEKKKNV